MSLMDTPRLEAADVAAARTEWGLNWFTSTPDSAIRLLIQRDTVAEVIGLCGFRTAVNNGFEPSSAGSSKVSVRFKYALKVVTGQTLGN